MKEHRQGMQSAAVTWACDGVVQLRQRSPGAIDVRRPPVTHLEGDELETNASIRCPHCQWRPAPSSRWCCDATGAPEPFFESCGTVWNTFSTHGRCPGCGHQWLWTSCLQCGQWSLHVDWYEEPAQD